MFKRLILIFWILLVPFYGFSQHYCEILLELRLNENICNSNKNYNFDLEFIIKNKTSENEILYKKTSTHSCTGKTLKISYSSLDSLNNFIQKGNRPQDLKFEANIFSFNHLIAFQNDIFFLPVTNDTVSVFLKLSENPQDSILLDEPVFIKDLNEFLNSKTIINKSSRINNSLKSGISEYSTQFTLENSNDSIIVYYILLEFFQTN